MAFTQLHIWEAEKHVKKLEEVYGGTKRTLEAMERGEPFALRALTTCKQIHQYLEKILGCSYVPELPLMKFIDDIQATQCASDTINDTSRKKMFATREQVIQEYKNGTYTDYKVLLWITHNDSTSMSFTPVNTIPVNTIVGQVMMCENEDDMEEEMWKMQGIISRCGYKIGSFLLETLRDHLEHSIVVKPIISNGPWYEKLKKFAKRKNGTQWIFETYLDLNASPQVIKIVPI